MWAAARWCSAPRRALRPARVASHAVPGLTQLAASGATGVAIRLCAQVYEQEDGLGLRVGTPFRGDSARSMTHERPSDSRSSERPKASRGSGRRPPITEADRLVLEDTEPRSVLPERPTDSRGSERPKASRGGERRPVASSDGERVMIDDRRPSDSRGGERPKASRGNDRLKSRGSDRGRGAASNVEGERNDRFSVRDGEILLNQDTPLTLEDWFSNPGLAVLPLCIRHLLVSGFAATATHAFVS